LLQGKYHFEPLAAKAISVTLATVFTYLGSRFWTFRERENQAVHREAVLFFVLNVVGLLIAEAVIGLVSYVMGLRGPLAYNAASFVGTGFGTIFRFYAYRKWVFLAPESAPEPAPLPNAPAFPDFPPWELDPAFLAPAEVAAQAPRPAASYPSPWERQPPEKTWDQGLAPSPWGAPGPYSASAFPAPGQPGPMQSAPRHPTPVLPAPVLPAPVQNARPAPAPPARPAPRSSGGGRHRKS
jgi:putative flippase GtrA